MWPFKEKEEYDFSRIEYYNNLFDMERAVREMNMERNKKERRRKQQIKIRSRRKYYSGF